MKNSPVFKKKSKLQATFADIQLESQKTDTNHQGDIAYQPMQDYYNKICGCSVKAQKDNLFEYKFQIKKGLNFGK